MAVQFILLNFVNYSPSIAMKLKVSKEIRGICCFCCVILTFLLCFKQLFLCFS